VKLEIYEIVARDLVNKSRHL